MSDVDAIGPKKDLWERMWRHDVFMIAFSLHLIVDRRIYIPRYVWMLRYNDGMGIA